MINSGSHHVVTKTEIDGLRESQAFMPSSLQSNTLIGLDTFYTDPKFSGYFGAGYTIAVLDTGIDLDHGAFGPDLDSDGVSDRIVYHQDFSRDGDNTVDDVDGHGTHVASLAVSGVGAYPGVAQEANVIALQVLDNTGSGYTSDIEAALQWVEANAAAYNIVSVNMSLGGGSNVNTEMAVRYLGDELSRLANMGVVTTASAGNSHYTWQSPGMNDIAADPNAISVGAVWEADQGSSWSWGSGARDYTTDTDRVVSFSQRSADVDMVFAPGAYMLGAAVGGGSRGMGGTSMAAPVVAGMVALAQEIADDLLGRRLSFQEFETLLMQSADTIFDGDDEDDNVTNLNAALSRVNMHSLAQAIQAMAPPTNTPPESRDDRFSVDEDTLLTGNLFANNGSGRDRDADGDIYWLTHVDGSALNVGVPHILASGAVVSVEANGDMVYDANGAYDHLMAGETATDTFTYQISDGTDRDQATVTVTINGVDPVNSPPKAQDDFFLTTEGDLLVGDLFAENNYGVDFDLDGDAFYIVEVNGGAWRVGREVALSSGARLKVEADGTMTYDQAGAFDGLDQGVPGYDGFTYTLSDGTNTDTARVTIEIDGVSNNRAPDARNDKLRTDEDTSLVADLFAANGAGIDRDADGDSFQIVAVNGSIAQVGAALGLASGALVLVEADGRMTYDPSGAFDYLNPGQTGADSFTYTISDGSATDTARVMLTIDGRADTSALNAFDDFFQVSAGQALFGNVFDDNGTGADLLAGGSLTNIRHAGVDRAVGDVFQTRDGGNALFSANGDFAIGSGSAPIDLYFQYTLSNGTQTDKALIKVAVTPPSSGSVDEVEAEPDLFTVAVDDVLSGNLFADNGNGADVAFSGALTLTHLNGTPVDPVHGLTMTLPSGAAVTVQSDGSFELTPLVSGFDQLNGTLVRDSFTYTVADAVSSNSALVEVDVDVSTAILGSDLADRLIGTSQDDILIGGGEDDRIRGQTGNDTMIGGDGADDLTGVTGDNTYIGGAGADQFYFDARFMTTGDVNTISDLSFDEGDQLIVAQFTAGTFFDDFNPQNEVKTFNNGVTSRINSFDDLLEFRDAGIMGVFDAGGAAGLSFTDAGRGLDLSIILENVDYAVLA